MGEPAATTGSRSIGMSAWRAGCAETCTSGSEGGSQKPTGRKTGRALRPDPYTQQRTGEGWLYLAVVLDAFSRRVVGWSMADHLRTELVLDALDMAIAQRDPTAGLVHHSDHGCQYTSFAFGRRLAASELVASMGTVGDALDNAVAESFFATLECELLDRYPWPTRAGLRTAIFDFIEVFYNRQRRHSTLDYHPPAAYEQHHASVASAA
jgi:putative transposase